MTMADWESELDKFLTYNERPILLDSGSISHERMERITAEQYEHFDTARKAQEDAAALAEYDAELKAIESLAIHKKKL